MPRVQPAASKYLAQKWEKEKFRVHRNRVRNAITLVDMSTPREFPHLKLAVNKKSIQDDRQHRYDQENLILLNKIKMLVKGNGTVNNWNTYIKKDSLHTAARLKQQREIEYQNELMLKRIQKAKPVVSKKTQEKDFRLHKRHQDILALSVKDYPSPQREPRQSESESNAVPREATESSEHKNPSEKNADSDEGTKGTSSEREASVERKSNEDLPPLPKEKKKKGHKSPQENRKENRTAAVPKLPKI